MTFSANEDIQQVERLIHRGEYPVEWKNDENQINGTLDASEWVHNLISRARVQLALFLLPEEHQYTLLADETIDDLKKNCKQFEMKEHNFNLTRSMAAAGWRQFQSVVNTKTKEQAEQEGLKFKRFRYAVHFWQAPGGQLVLGKVKLEGKYVPPGERSDLPE
jgi:hypothetical protein